MSPVEAGKLLSCDINETEFQERYMILKRMQYDRAFEEQVVLNQSNRE